MRVIILPTAIFKTVFDEYNFSIISNLFQVFDSNKPYALSKHSRKCANKMHHIFGEALGIRVKKFKQNLPENYSKSTKITVTARESSKIFGKACLRTP